MVYSISKCVFLPFSGRCLRMSSHPQPGVVRHIIRRAIWQFPEYLVVSWRVPERKKHDTPGYNTVITLQLWLHQAMLIAEIAGFPTRFPRQFLQRMDRFSNPGGFPRKSTGPAATQLDNRSPMTAVRLPPVDDLLNHTPNLAK